MADTQEITTAVVVQQQPRRAGTDIEDSIASHLHEVSTNMALLAQEIKFMGEKVDKQAGYEARLVKLETELEIQKVATSQQIAANTQVINQRLLLGGLFVTVAAFVVPILLQHWK